MYTNMALDFGIGLVPIIGDLADAWFKCNTRNNILLERFLRERGQKHPAPPPEPKQSTMRRWFGSGPSAPGSHAVVTQSDGTHVPAPTTAAPNMAATSPPELPPRKGFNVFGSKSATQGGAQNGADEDLEAQSHGGDIHYSRE